MPNNDHDNINRGLLYAPSHKTRSKKHHKEKVKDIPRSILLISAPLFLKKTKKPIIKATTEVGMCE
jgi:hypothetical protein